MQSDRQLIEAVLGGDRAAYAELVRRYEGSVRAVAVSVLCNVHDAQDAAQEAFIKAFAKLPALKNRRKFGPWVLKIARRAALDLASRKARLPAMQPLETAEPTGHDGQLDQDAESLLAAVMRLPEQEKGAVLMHHFDGHPVREVAALTGRSVGTVTKQLSRAYARLRQQLPELKP